MMLNYKISYQNKQKSQSIKKAQKILKKKNKLQINHKQNTFTQTQLHKKDEKLKIHKSQCQRIRLRCNSQLTYSSFCRNNYQIGNFNKFKNIMKSQTDHYTNVISLHIRQNRQSINKKYNKSSLRLSHVQKRSSFLKSSRQRINTQGKEEQKTKQLSPMKTLSPIKTFHGLKLISNPTLRTSSLFRVSRQTQRQAQQKIVEQKIGQKQGNIYIKKELTKKKIFSKRFETTYIQLLPMIKQKKIHFR